MQQAFPQIVEPIQKAIVQIEADLEQLTQARKDKKAELRQHRKALAALNGTGRRPKKQAQTGGRP